MREERERDWDSEGGWEIVTEGERGISSSPLPHKPLVQSGVFLSQSSVWYAVSHVE